MLKALENVRPVLEAARPPVWPQEAEGTQPRLDELLGTVAHELRNPLVTILNGVSMITSRYDLDPAARRALDVIERQSLQATRMIDDLFDLCAGGLGKLSLRKQVLYLGGVTARATESTGHLLAARGHRFTVSLPPEPLFFEADPLRLNQVLTNLLCNAAKFTEVGGDIRLGAAVEGEQVVFSVRDNGKGIPAELLPRIFELFRQAPGTKRSRTSGLGIGLALVKTLAELHGGSVAARSAGPGAGSEFLVHLPICASPS